MVSKSLSLPGGPIAEGRMMFIPPWTGPGRDDAEIAAVLQPAGTLSRSIVRRTLPESSRRPR